jgi:DNA polymerase V
MIINFPNKIEKSVNKVYSVSISNEYPLTLYTSPVYAGAPALSEDFIEGKLDLTEHLVKNPEKTFIVKVSGDSMREANIHPEDLLLVDSSIRAKTGNIVVAAVNGELTVKRLHVSNQTVFLMPENSGYAGIEVTRDMDFVIWGVVTNVIHKIT